MCNISQQLFFLVVIIAFVQSRHDIFNTNSSRSKCMDNNLNRSSDDKNITLFKENPKSLSLNDTWDPLALQFKFKNRGRSEGRTNGRTKAPTFYSCSHPTYEAYKPCPIYFHELRVPGLKKCIFESSSVVDGKTARKSCPPLKYKQSYLAEPTTRRESIALFNQLYGQTSWIGVYKNGQKYKYGVDKKHNVQGVMWSSGYPKSRPCVLIKDDGFWEDFHCRGKKWKYVCEYAHDWVEFKTDVKHKKKFPTVGDLYTMETVVLAPELTNVFLHILEKKSLRHVVTYWIELSRGYVIRFEAVSKAGGYEDLVTHHKQFTEFVTPTPPNANDEYQMCLVRLTVQLTLRTRYSPNGHIYQWCVLNHCPITHDDVIPNGPTQPEFLGGIETLSATPGVAAYSSYKKSFKCLCRVSVDSKAWCGVHLLPHNDENDPEVVPNNLPGWHVEHWADLEKGIKDQGPATEVISFKKADRLADSTAQGAYDFNISFSLGLNITRLHKAKLMCKTHTKMPKKTDYPNYDETEQINVQFPPGRAELTVFWPGTPGEFWLGVPLRAQCKAYIGSRIHRGRAPAIEWMVYKAPRVTPLVRHNVFLGRSGRPWINFKNINIPEKKECEPSEHTIMELGACVRIVQDPPLSWVDAQRYCRKNFNYNLATIRSDRHFRLLKELLKDDGYFLGISDIRRRRRYVTVDGHRVDLKSEYWRKFEEHEITWSSDPSGRRCVVIHTAGLEKYSCDSRLSFVCQSQDNMIVSPMNFDPDLGNFITSTFEIIPDASIIGMSLQCASYPSRYPVPPGLEREELFSNRTSTFVLKYGQTVPTLNVSETIQGDDVIITIKCRAQVGSDGAMTITLRHARFHTPQKWVIYGEEDQVVETHKTSRAIVNITENAKESNISHKIESTMALYLTLDLHGATFTCYPYDVTDLKTKIVSYVSQSRLKVSHVIDIHNLSTVSFSEVEEVYERVYGPEFNIHHWLRHSEADNDDLNNNGDSSHAFFIIHVVLINIAFALVMAVVLSKKDSEVARHSSVYLGESSHRHSSLRQYSVAFDRFSRQSAGFVPQIKGTVWQRNIYGR